MLSPHDYCISVLIVYDEGRFALVEQNIILNAIVLIMQGTMPLFTHGNILFLKKKAVAMLLIIIQQDICC